MAAPAATFENGSRGYRRPQPGPTAQTIERSLAVVGANHVGERLSAGLEALMGDGLFTEVCGVRAIWAAQLSGEDITARGIKIRDRMLELGVACRAINGALAFRPPLIIKDEDIDKVVDICAQAVREFQ